MKDGSSIQLRGNIKVLPISYCVSEKGKSFLVLHSQLSVECNKSINQTYCNYFQINKEDCQKKS